MYNTPRVRDYPDCFSLTAGCTILGRCFDRANRPEEAHEQCTRTPVLKAVIVIVTLQSMVNPVMSQPNCDVVKIATDYTRTRWSWVDLTTDRRVITSLEGTVWKIRFTLPDDTLGFVPEIGIDQRTCQVVSAVLWQ
jgi:hypothetical protein